MALTDGKGLTQAPAFGTPEYTDWYYNNPAGPGYNPATINTPPAFGTPAYTEWYYNNPAGPGFNQNGKVVKVEANTGIVKVIDKSTGSEVVTGIVKPIDLEQSKAAANQVIKPEIIEVQDPAKIQVVQQAVQDLKPYEVKPGLYDINQYLIDNINDPRKAFNNLYKAGFSKEAVSKAAHENLAAANKKNNEAQKSLASKVWQGMTPWDESKDETATAGGVGTMAAEILVPGVYTARHWDEMSGGEKAFSIALDVVSLIPYAGAAARGAKVISTAGRAVRLAGAAKGVGREAVAQLRAPVDMILHPVSTVKGAAKQGREVVENIAHPSKIPEAVITTADNTVRLRVTEATTPAEAKAIADKLTMLAAKGDKPRIEVNGQVVELAQSPLMKETGGMAHATPDIEILEGQKVKLMPEKGQKEQGWFLSNEPVTQFTQSTAFGKGAIPVPVGASGKVTDIGKYRPTELVLLDKKPIRNLNFADAKDIPANIAGDLFNYAKSQDAVVYGSMNEWTKVKKAARPNDIDLVFKDPEKATRDIEAICKKAGYETRQVPHGVEILKDGEWVKLGDIVSEDQHRAMLPFEMITTRINGIQVETLGKQYLGQAYGAIGNAKKAPIRAKKLEKAAADVKKMIQEAGITEKKPGIFIVSPETAAETVSSKKLFTAKGVGKVAEMERVLPVGKQIPNVKQKLFTRVGPMGQKVEIYLEKPLSPAQILKLKGLAAVEDLKAPFKPAITVSKAGAADAKIAGITENELDDVTDILRRSGNTDQADAMRQTKALTRSQRMVPRSLEDITGRPDPSEVDAERVKLDQGTEPTRAAADEPARSAETQSKSEDWDRSDPFDDRNSYDPYADEPAMTEAPARESTRSETPRNEETRTEPARTEDQRREVARQTEQRADEARPAEQRLDTTRPPDPPRPPGNRPPINRPPDPDRIERPPETPRPPEPPRGSSRSGQVRESGKGSTLKPPRIGLPGKNEQTGERTFNKGTVAWKQGIGWWVWKPPYRNQDREFVFAKPTGAEITADARTAFGTVQAIGGSGVVNKGFDMGIVDVELNKAPATPSRSAGHKELKFKRDTDHIRAKKGTRPASGRRMGPYYYKNGALAKKPLS